MRQVFLLLLLLWPLFLPAQRDLNEAAFIVNGKLLSMPYAGGVNSIIASAADLDRDGKADLLLFDKSDNHYMSFRNEGVAGESKYVLDQSLHQHFPSVLDYAFLLDINHDGAADLFSMSAQGGAGIALYFGRWEGNRLAFDLMSDRLRDSTGRALYIDRTNLPAFYDMNGDGDLDIVLVDFGYSTLTYYENLEVEKNLSGDTLVLLPKSNCWGYVCECSLLSNAMTLNYQDGICFHRLLQSFPGEGGGAATHSRHTGATLLIFDPDADADPDLLIGDAGFSNLIYLENGKSDLLTPFDSIIGLDTAFPSYDQPVDYNIFPTPFYIDLNNDLKKDLLISTFTTPACYINSILDTQYNRDLIWYANEGSDGRDSFRLQPGSFLTDEMIDIGFGAHAAWFDYNADGLMDIVSGRCYQRSASDPDSVYTGLALFENTGTASAPVFSLVDADYGGLGRTLGLGLLPSFQDADGDGDQDMVVAERGGSLFFYRNEAPAGQTALFVKVNGYFDGVKLLSDPAPFLCDVDGDGVIDLLLGEKQGRVFYFRNYGTAASPDFRLENDFWGEVDARQGYFYGNAVPWLGDEDGDGKRELLVGNYLGRVMKYTNIDGNLNGKFTLADGNYLKLNWGGQLGIDVRDVNQDGHSDYLLSNYRGGLRIRTFAGTVGIGENEKSPSPFLAYPNPASGFVTLSSRHAKPMEGRLFSISGEELMNFTLASGEQHTLALQSFPPGLYFLSLSDGEREFRKKIVLIR